MFKNTDMLARKNTKKKIYPNGYEKIIFCSKHIFTSDYSEHFKVGKEKDEETDKRTYKENETRKDSLKRAKEKVFDIAYLNEFDYFVTWTLDKDLIDRYDPIAVSKKLKTWLNNMSKRKNLKYLVIPEHHKDGAIHVHGLISGDINLIDSGKTDKSGHTIYNMPDWRYGFSTAIKTYGQIENCAKYITKYITKDLIKIFGNFYYAGGNINRKPKIELFDTNYYTVDATEYSVPIANMAFKYAQIRNGDFIAK